ncbi:preprotein translocase subunit SECE1-like [Actinidia eriantha]|uniref:preprotein translocase subunit SECE1-like n=1 Tax=Actinidia eriantha TaxID=165200 RepID=UPI0025848404|nr:preprotein translocase subunit SECE1-like [Actinidia eriantha]
MALHLCLQFPKIPLPSSSSSSSQIKPKSIFAKPITKTITKTTKIKTTQFAIKATTSETENPEPEPVSNEPQSEPTSSTIGDLSELGAEIKKAMNERDGEDGGGGDFWGGVAAEIREIEWPPFGKVVGITGVVLGVIAGSSVVLFTVNAVLAELSDRVFAEKGFRIFSDDG